MKTTLGLSGSTAPIHIYYMDPIHWAPPLPYIPFRPPFVRAGGVLCFCGSSRQFHVSPTLRIQTNVVDGFYNPDKSKYDTGGR